MRSHRLSNKWSVKRNAASRQSFSWVLFPTLSQLNQPTLKQPSNQLSTQRPEVTLPQHLEEVLAQPTAEPNTAPSAEPNAEPTDGCFSLGTHGGLRKRATPKSVSFGFPKRASNEDKPEQSCSLGALHGAHQEPRKEGEVPILKVKAVGGFM